MPGEENELEKFTGYKDDAGGQQPGEKFSDHQDFAADGSQKVEVQAAVEDFAAKQVHEDSQATEEDGQAKIEKLKYSGKGDRVFAHVGAGLVVDALNFVVRQLHP